MEKYEEFNTATATDKLLLISSPTYWSSLTSSSPHFLSLLSLIPSLTLFPPTLLSTILSSSTKLLSTSLSKQPSFDIIHSTLSTLLSSPTTPPQLSLQFLSSLSSLLASSSKYNKKTYSSTLSLLPLLLPLLPSPELTFYLNLTLFSLDNLKLSLARHSYNTSSTTSAISPLFSSLSPLPQSLLTTSLPPLLTLYLHSLTLNSQTLFPLPTKNSHYPTLASYKSASLLFSLEALREKTAEWFVELLALPGVGVGVLRESLEVVLGGKLESRIGGWGEVWKGLVERALGEGEEGEKWKLMEIVARVCPESLGREGVEMRVLEALKGEEEEEEKKKFVESFFASYSGDLGGGFLKNFIEVTGGGGRNSILTRLVFNFNDNGKFLGLMRNRFIGLERVREGFKTVLKLEGKGEGISIRVLTLMVRVFGNVEGVEFGGLLGEEVELERLELRGALKIEVGEAFGKKLVKELMRGDAERKLSIIKLLFQSLSTTANEDCSKTLTTIIDLIPSSSASWNGFLRGTSTSNLGTAIFNFITSNPTNLNLIESKASLESIQKLCSIIISSLSSDEEEEGSVTIGNTTKALLHRADFFEFPIIREQFLNQLSTSTTSNFSSISTLIPLGYLNKRTKNSLMKISLSAGGKKVDLRRFERWVLSRESGGGGVELKNSAKIGYGLLGEVGDDEEENEVTVQLFLDLLKISISNYKSDSKSKEDLLDFVKVFKGFGKGSSRAIEGAFYGSLDVFVESFNEFNKLSTELQESLKTVIEKATQPFLKSLKAVKGNEVDKDLVEVIKSCKAFWSAKDWISVGEEGVDDKFAESCASFSQLLLGKLFSNSTDGRSKSKLAILELLGFRLKKLRSLSDPEKISTDGFETLVACCLVGGKETKEILKKSTAAASLREYSIVVEGISNFVATVVGKKESDVDVEECESCLNVAVVILRDGPPGSSRIAGACLSEILQHLGLLVRRQNRNASSTPLLLVVSKFLEEICGDSPLLLSRHDVSSLLALVCLILQPSSSSSSTLLTTWPSLTASTSELFRSLVTIIDILVRHRKEHLTSLFPLLVASLSSITSSLRRAGYGTPGLTTSEELETGVTLGKRAERESKATFAPWVWEGGPLAIGKVEAKVFGRLLSRLTTKTPTNSLKRKRDETIVTSSSLAAPLSKHAPFIILPYLKACVDPISPIPSALRSEMQGGWFEVMDVMSKWEREALIKGFLVDGEELERGVLRGLWKSWEKERYRG